MKIDIEKIGPEGLDLDEPVTHMWLDEILGEGCEFQPAQDGRLTVHLDRLDDVVYVRGRAVLRLQAQCSRCLNPVTLALDAPLEVTMVPRTAEPAPEDDGELSEEDIGISVYDEREIDLARVVHDEVLLDLPMRALCASDCAGLCTTCGKNLNESACGCEPQGDMRWGALRRIKLS